MLLNVTPALDLLKTMGIVLLVLSAIVAVIVLANYGAKAVLVLKTFAYNNLRKQEELNTEFRTSLQVMKTTVDGLLGEMKAYRAESEFLRTDSFKIHHEIKGVKKRVSVLEKAHNIESPEDGQ